MSDNEQKAMQLVADAEKKLKSSQGFLGSFFKSSSKIEDACEMYTRAANMFKMAKKWSAAGSAFNEAAELRLKSENPHEAASCFVDAANCYKKSDPHEGIKCLIKAIEYYTEMGRFTIAAKHHMTVAEIYETEVADIEKAMNHYEQAADFFRGEESNSSANKCMLSVAKYAANLEQYEKAIDIYEQIGEASLASPLMKYSAKEYYFNASLLHMCVDVTNCQQAMAKYGEMCPSFNDSREFKFVQTLCENLEEQDIEAFTETVKEYDSISRLDSWYTNILLRVKKQLQETPDLC